jgi:hypothetical protein
MPPKEVCNKAVTYQPALARKSVEKQFCFGLQLGTMLHKFTQMFLRIQIDFYIICNTFWFNNF